MCSVTESCLFETPWTVACQAPLSVGFPRQEHWSGVPVSSPCGLGNSKRNQKDTVVFLAQIHFLLLLNPAFILCRPIFLHWIVFIQSRFYHDVPNFHCQ